MNHVLESPHSDKVVYRIECRLSACVDYSVRACVDPVKPKHSDILIGIKRIRRGTCHPEERRICLFRIEKQILRSSG